MQHTQGARKASESAWRVGSAIGLVSAALLYVHLLDIELSKWWVPAVAIAIGWSGVRVWDTAAGPPCIMVASGFVVVASALLVNVHLALPTVFVVVALLAAVRLSLRRFGRARRGLYDGQSSVEFPDGELARTSNVVEAGVVSAWLEEASSTIGYRHDAGPRYRVLVGAPKVLSQGRVRILAQGALVLAVLATASSIYLNEVRKRDLQVNTAGS